MTNQQQPNHRRYPYGRPEPSPPRHTQTSHKQRTRPDFPVHRGLFQAKAAIAITPVFMGLCVCLACGATGWMVGQEPVDGSVSAAWLAILCGGGGVLAVGYVGALIGYGKLFNKRVDERIEREAEVYRRGFRE